ncbi:hypothetical protein Tco_1172218 [Tanacetum coccineum]
MSSSETVYGSFGGDVILTRMGFVVDRGWREIISLLSVWVQPGDVSSLKSDIGKVQIVLDFENSALRLPSAEKGFKKLTGSIRTQGESSSTSFRAENSCPEVISSLHKHADPGIVAFLNPSREGSPDESLPKSLEKKELHPPETSSEATSNTLKRKLFPDDLAAQKKVKKTNGKTQHCNSNILNKFQ